MNLLGILAIFIQNLLFSEAQKLLDSSKLSNNFWANNFWNYLSVRQVVSQPGENCSFDISSKMKQTSI